MEDSKAFVSKYVSDQLILIQHSLEVVESQSRDSDLADQPDVLSLLSEIKATLAEHEKQLKLHLESNFADSERPVTAKITDIFTSITGSVTGLYNNLRTEKVSKMLRDDYTALCLGTLTYSMLLTTSRSLNQDATADLCTSLMRDFPILVLKLNEIIPQVVNDDLTKRGFNVKPEAAAEAVDCSKKAWSTH